MSVTSNEKQRVRVHIQIVRRLIDIVQAEDIRVINQLHKYNLALNPEHDLLLLFAGMVYGHTAGDERLLGDDLNGSVLLRLDMSSNLDATCCVCSQRSSPSVGDSKRRPRRTRRAPANRPPNFPVSDHPALAVAF